MLPVTDKSLCIVTAPDIVPPEELNFVLAVLYAACANVALDAIQVFWVLLTAKIYAILALAVLSPP